MIEKVRQMLAQDRRLTLRLTAEELDISKDTVHTIVRDDLVRSGIKTAIDVMVFTDFPATKTKSRLQKSKEKTLLIAFFDNNGIIHKEFVPAGQTINSAYYQSVLNLLLQRIQRVRPELHRTGKWMLLHDNAPAHCAIRVRQFLAQKMVVDIRFPEKINTFASAHISQFMRSFNVDEIGDSEMAFGEMKSKTRQGLPDIRLTVGKKSEKKLNQEPGGSLPPSHKPAIGPYPVQD
ncbi:hypothetical protein ANN_02621 [Periplaneta americana]|uniref:Uncharacterized protein n=1 Tax=Periplaneta americana TaxID=6978 RepID=A0ABQ8TWW7_PERAM|nr:hypothetical protein ANN_02621 [Periplaneta americana]